MCESDVGVTIDCGRSNKSTRNHNHQDCVSKEKSIEQKFSEFCIFFFLSMFYWCNRSQVLIITCYFYLSVTLGHLFLTLTRTRSRLRFPETRSCFLYHALSGRTRCKAPGSEGARRAERGVAYRRACDASGAGDAGWLPEWIGRYRLCWCTSEAKTGCCAGPANGAAVEGKPR